MLVVIEGIDGAGCETQGKKLLKRLRDKAFLLKYPDYTKNVGSFIKKFLYNNKDLSLETQFLLYSLQFIFDAPEIREKRKKQIVIADRYFSTTLCFQTLAGISITKALRFADDFNIEKPDLIIYLDVPPQLAIKRKMGEDKQKNRNEKDTQLIENTYQQYKKLIKNQTWSKWTVVDGKRQIEPITNEIFDIIKKESKQINLE